MNQNIVWSTKTPTEPGQYWFKDDNIKPCIIFIDEPELLMDGYQWAKIEEPKEKED